MESYSFFGNVLGPPQVGTPSARKSGEDTTLDAFLAAIGTRHMVKNRNAIAGDNSGRPGRPTSSPLNKPANHPVLPNRHHWISP